LSLDLSTLGRTSHLLFSIALEPLQGHRFQPTGFPSLGAATYQTPIGTALLVESAQSMANRLELTVWDEASNDLMPQLQGLSHVRILRNGAFLTDTILDAHRINSPYLLMGKDQGFFNILKEALGCQNEGPVNRCQLAKVLLKYDVGSLLHGTFLAKKELAGGRLRIARAISSFIEAENIGVAASGGVKSDHVNPSGDTRNGFGNIPFARDEFTAERITLYANIDLAQIRGYGLGAEAERLLILLSLYKLRSLLEGSLRLRTACDLHAISEEVSATTPAHFRLPATELLLCELQASIGACQSLMSVTEVHYNDELKKGKDEDESALEAAAIASLDED
jgi:CRISPR-associated protein Csb1